MILVFYIEPVLTTELFGGNENHLAVAPFEAFADARHDVLSGRSKGFHLDPVHLVEDDYRRLVIAANFGERGLDNREVVFELRVTNIHHVQ